MGKMSAKFVGKKVGKNTAWVYSLWQDMGIVTKDNFGDWILTDLGRKCGGKMSKGQRVSVPTFDFDCIEKMMIDFYKKYKL